MNKFKICGFLYNSNKRFVIKTNTPENYNLWRANIYLLLDSGHYKRISNVFNF